MAACENVSGCTNTASTTVPMFMGAIKVCAGCEAELTAPLPVAPRRIAVGDYVKIAAVGAAGYVEAITDAGLRVVWSKLEEVLGKERLTSGCGVWQRHQLELV